MMDLRTTFVGLELKSPVIAGSCGLTADLNKIQEMAKHGAGAVILKSVFEEQMNREASQCIDDSYPEETDYIQTYVRAHAIQKYIDLIRSAKAQLDIPVIASINCLHDGEWVSFAGELEKAGADALELNLFVLPTDEFAESAEVERLYFDVVKHVKSVVKLPIIVKISHYFTNLPAFVSKLKAYGADAVTLFNRFYEPDINIEQLSVGAASVLGVPTDIKTTLRWTGILSGKDRQLEISASGGAHSGEAVVKLLLAGATTVQVCSALYQQGTECIGTMCHFLGDWMKSKSFKSIDEFRGKLSYADAGHADRYERAQFMKYFSDKKD